MKEEKTTAAAQTTAARIEEIKNRLRAALVKKYGSLYRASIKHGRQVMYTHKFFYRKTLNFNNFLMLCEWADVSPRYVLNGGRLIRWRGTEKLSFDGILKAYEKGKNFDAKIRVLIYNLRSGKACNLNLKTLLTFAELTGSDPADLIGA